MKVAQGIASIVTAVVMAACASTAPKSQKASSEPPRLLPSGVYFGDPGRPYQVVGTVRTWKEFATSLDDSFNEQEMQRRCNQAFFDASTKLLGIARENGGEAVMDVRSVIFLADGRKEYHPRAECSEDGEEGEALVQGTAIKWTAAPRAKAASGAAKPAAASTPVKPAQAVSKP